jgi:hypothetical protein
MWLAIAGAVAGAAPAAAAPPAREELAPDEVRKAEKLLDDLHDAVVKHLDACPKMATALGAVLTKHQDWLRKTVEGGKDVPQAAKDKLRKRQIETVGGLRKCKDDKGVQAAKDRFLSLLTPPLAPSRSEGGAAAAPSPPAKK